MSTETRIFVASPGCELAQTLEFDSSSNTTMIARSWGATLVHTILGTWLIVCIVATLTEVYIEGTWAITVTGPVAYPLNMMTLIIFAC